jgi:hypothetical protein
MTCKIMAGKRKVPTNFPVRLRNFGVSLVMRADLKAKTLITIVLKSMAIFDWQTIISARK